MGHRIFFALGLVAAACGFTKGENVAKLHLPKVPSVPKLSKPLTPDQLGQGLSYQFGLAAQPEGDVGSLFNRFTDVLKRPSCVVVGMVESFPPVIHDYQVDMGHCDDPMCLLQKVFVTRLNERTEILTVGNAPEMLEVDGGKLASPAATVFEQCRNAMLGFLKDTMPLALAVDEASKGLTDAWTVSSTANNSLTIQPPGFDNPAVFQADEECTRVLLSEIASLHAFEAGIQKDPTITQKGPRLFILAPVLGSRCFRNSRGVDSPQYKVASALVFHSVLAAIETVSQVSHGSSYSAVLAWNPKSTEKAFDVVNGLVDSILRTMSDSRKVVDIVSVKRRLQSSNDSDIDENDKVSPQRAKRFQITLWTSVVMIFAGFLAVYTMFSMSNVRDPLLYTKINTAAHRA